MSAPLKPIADEYLRETHIIKPGDRLHRLISRMADTYYDDLWDERIEQLERQVDEWRWMHADATRFTDATDAAEIKTSCPVCGNEERGQGGYLSCECPTAPTNS